MFKSLFSFGNRYASQSNWVDFALTKLCLFSMGLAAGAQVPEKRRKAVTAVAAAGFLAAYVPLMINVFRVAMKKEKNV